MDRHLVKREQKGIQLIADTAFEISKVACDFALDNGTRVDISHLERILVLRKEFSQGTQTISSATQLLELAIDALNHAVNVYSRGYSHEISLQILAANRKTAHHGANLGQALLLLAELVSERSTPASRSPLLPELIS